MFLCCQSVGRVGIVKEEKKHRYHAYVSRPSRHLLVLLELAITVEMRNCAYPQHAYRPPHPIPNHQRQETIDR